MKQTELLDLIAASLDAEQILDILGWTTYELVEALKEHIEEHEDDFLKAVD